MTIIAAKEGHEGLVQTAPKNPKEEGRRIRRQGQKEEVVQGKGPRQVEQSSLVRQGVVRQTVEGSPVVQTHHPVGRQRTFEGPWVVGKESFG